MDSLIMQYAEKTCSDNTMDVL